MSRFRLSHKYWFLFLVSVLITVLLGQFLLFRWEAVYKLNLKTSLYDHAAWIGKPPIVVIMGSSQARYGIIPSIICETNRLDPDTVCNLGADAATPFEMYETYIKQRRVLSKARFFYYTIEPWIFSTKYFRFKKYEKIYLTYRQWDLLHQEFNIPNEYMMPVRIFIDSLEFGKAIRPLGNGYIPLRGTHRFQTSREFLIDYEPYGEFPISRFQLLFLRKLKEVVEQDGGIFICVYTPKHRSWHQYYEKYCGKYNADFVSLFNRYMGPVRLVGSYRDTSYKLTDADFFDTFHINETGAKRFTSVVFSDIYMHIHRKPELLDLSTDGHKSGK